MLDIKDKILIEIETDYLSALSKNENYLILKTYEDIIEKIKSLKIE